jgi:hypothetical protein
MLYLIDPIDDLLAAKSELAEKFYFHYERQEWEQRPTKRAFGCANSGLMFLALSVPGGPAAAR